MGKIIDLNPRTALNKKWKKEKVLFKEFIGMMDDPWDDNTEELCNELIRWYEFGAKNGWTFESTTDTALPNYLRKDECLYPINMMVENLFPEGLLEQYWNGLQRCLAVYIKQFDLNNVVLHHKTFKMHKVLPKQGYHLWHFEDGNFEGNDRMLVYSTYLRVPEKGGETEFLYQSHRVKPIVGRTLIWPAGFTHLHRGNPPLDGEKIYITGWFSVAPTAEQFLDSNDERWKVAFDS